MTVGTGQGCHHGRVAEVKCAGCQSVSSRHDSTATRWDCSCGSSYVLRRCSACKMVSHVSSLQRNGEPSGLHEMRGPQLRVHHAAGPGGGDTGRPRRRRGAVRPGIVRCGRDGVSGHHPGAYRDHEDIPGYRITAVHGDVFGLVVRARNVFSNIGAQFRTAVGGEVVGYTKLLTASRNQARERMWQEAAAGRERGRRDALRCNEIGDIMSEWPPTNRGTAEPNPPPAVSSPTVARLAARRGPE